jgi:hypothetical protein
MSDNHTYNTTDQLTEAAEHLEAASELLQSALLDVPAPIASIVIRGSQFAHALAEFLTRHAARLKRVNSYA